MLDESDVAQAHVFYEMLSAEAESLAVALRPHLTRRGVPRASAEARLLERDLREVRRCLGLLRDRFPELGRGAVVDG
ncbi:hypothetical protein [Nocardia pseudobrasiliensis]|uniref:Uncharacterized protein n=1 Tax=Nocardia pseudobrasiliensis TaxID=45979 RepID=A0A370HXT0_9NOCA|nr:hypothetical protein [Nocardia pseudobrasiliensis]RDI63326.1 hypothetical protein DFR76_11023 [Nocardia pseudobrasiliensis]